MVKKMVGFFVAAFLALPLASWAQGPSSSEKSIANLSITDIADDSIVVLSQEDTGVPGYVHQKYAFNCLGEFRLVDYYGPALNVNDKDIVQFERMMCVRQQMNDYDTSE